MVLINVPSLELIIERLPLIFTEGIENRNYVIRDMAARTIFVMFYSGAVEGVDLWIRPSQVTDMTNEQAALVDETSRRNWIKYSLSSKKIRPSSTWYAGNSREPIRDETIKSGLIPCGAVVVRLGLPITSLKPRYAIKKDFAALFDINLVGDDLQLAISDWQDKHLSKNALSRLRLVKHGALVAEDAVPVIFPNGETRALQSGPSSVIAKAVIEIFANKYLKKPAVLWLSESGNKVVARDDELARSLGLTIDPSKTLPDIILIDLGDLDSGEDMLVVFIEVVASDGPINRERKSTLTDMALAAGFDEKHLAFLTAYFDRGKAEFKKSVSELAWGSYAWCLSEPDNIIELTDDSPRKLSDTFLKR